MRLFISYKSEDCDAVRAVAERLMSVAIPIWFTEYQVLPWNYDAFEGDLDRQLRDAVHGCSHALVFTNDRWSRSEFCRQEMRTIAAAIPAQNVIEVRLSRQDLPHREFPSLELGPTLDYAQDPQATAASVLSLIGVQPARVADPCCDRGQPLVCLPRFGLAFDPGPFERTIVESRLNPGVHGAPALALRTEVAGQLVKLIVIVFPFDSVLRSLQVPQEEAGADREIYARYRRYVQSWENHFGVTPRGLHLWFLDGRSQLAVTYAAPEDDPRGPLGSWERRYVLSPTDAAPAQRGEVHFLFYAPIRGTDEEQLQKFAALCPLLDRTVQSIQQRPVSAPLELRNALPQVSVRLFYLALCGWAAVAVGGPAHPTWFVALSVIAGAVAADLVVIVRSSAYRLAAWEFGGGSLFDDSMGGESWRMLDSALEGILRYPVVLTKLNCLDVLLCFQARSGGLRFLGPGLPWLVVVWVLALDLGVARAGLAWSGALAALFAFAVERVVVHRFIRARVRRTRDP